MNRVRRQFIDTDMGQIHLRKAGDLSSETPLICLHQSPKSSREFVPFMEAICGDRPVIALDSPGHGESDIPPEAPPVTIQDYARTLWQVIDALGLETIDLFGNHTGAKVAVEMAHQKPQNVRYILLMSALVLSKDEQKQFEDMFQPIPLDDEGTRFHHMWTQIQKYRTPGMTLEHMATSFAENLRAGEAYEWGHRAAFAYNQYFPDVVASLPHRITVFNPKDMLFEWTPRVAPLLKNGSVIDRADWGHDVLNVFPDSVAEAVKAELDGA